MQYLMVGFIFLHIEERDRACCCSCSRSPALDYEASGCHILTLYIHEVPRLIWRLGWSQRPESTLCVVEWASELAADICLSSTSRLVLLSAVLSSPSKGIQNLVSRTSLNCHLIFVNVFTLYIFLLLIQFSVF